MPKNPTLLLAAAVAALLLPPMASAAERALDYAQLDVSSDSQSLVLARTLGEPRAADPAPVVTVAASRWAEGETFGAGIVARRALVTGPSFAWRAGLGLGVDRFHDRGSDENTRTGASLRAMTEADGALGPGRYYVLAQFSSFRSGRFATAQYTFDAGPGLDVARYIDRSYRATTVTLRLPLGRAGWAVRLGAVRDDSGDRPFVGVMYNGF